MVRCRLRAGASPSFRSSLLPAAPSAVPSAAAAAAGARAPSLAAAGAGAGAAAAAAPPLLALALRRGRPQASKSSRASRPVSSTVGSARHASSVSCLFGLGGGMHRRWRRWTSRKDSCLSSCLRRRWGRPTRHTNTRINTSPSHLVRAWRWSGSAPAAPPPRPASACGSRCLQDGAGVCGSVNRRVLPDPRPAARTRR